MQQNSPGVGESWDESHDKRRDMSISLAHDMIFLQNVDQDLYEHLI